MKDNIHGVVSLMLILGAFATADAVLFNDHPGWGILYLLLVAILLPVVLYAYCAKCECREIGCRHVIPGPLTRLLPDRAPGPYHLLDYAGVGVPLAILVLVPQPLLIRHPLWLVLFWLLLITGTIQILLFVCRGCGNRKCPMCTLRNP